VTFDYRHFACAKLCFQSFDKHARQVPDFKTVPQSLFSVIHHSFKLLWAVVLLAALFSATPTLAQAQTSADAIGLVETLAGNATATRANRKIAPLKVGNSIYSGDTVQTGANSRLGITFVDGTVFSLSANAKMVINDLVYNSSSGSNKMLVGLLKGGFVFLAGNIAGSGTMEIDTPMALLGIRGTQPWVTVAPTTSFTIMSERDGTTGEYVLLRKGTNNIIATVNLTTVGTTKKYIMSSPADNPRLVDKTPAELRLEPQLKRALQATLRTRDARLDQQPENPRGPDNKRLKIKTETYYDVIDPSSNSKIEIKVETFSPLNFPQSENTSVYKMTDGEWVKIPRKSKLYTYIMNNISAPEDVELGEITEQNPLADLPMYDIGVRPVS